jgi:hypothetical protein
MSVANILPGLVGQPSENLVRDIEPSSSYIKALKERFSRATNEKLSIISCYELRQTSQSEFGPDGSIVRSGLNAMTAPESTACLYWANEVRVPINENHSMIAKLAKREGSAYHTVVGHIAELVVASMVRAARGFLPDPNTGYEDDTTRVKASDRVRSRTKRRSLWKQTVERRPHPGIPTRLLRRPNIKVEAKSCDTRMKGWKRLKKPSGTLRESLLQ